MKKYSKYLVLLFVVALLLSLFPTCAFAESKYTEWTFSENDSVLSDGTRTFKRYENAPPDLCVSSPVIYEYSEFAETCYGEACYVSSYSKDAPIVWVYMNGANVYYATEEGEAELDKFLSDGAVVGAYFLKQFEKGNRYYASVDGETVKLFEACAKKTQISVRSLLGAKRYEIKLRSEDGAFEYTYATVFEKDGSFYYIAHAGLPNNCFDADGGISLRSGEVGATVLDAQSAEKLTGAIEAIAYTPVTYMFERNEEEPVDNTTALIAFWAIYIVIGFAAPIPLLALGLILPHSQKRGQPKYWYRLAVVGALWIALALALAIVILI